MKPNPNVVILGLALTSSWGNGHATIYRALVREMRRRGWRPLFLERDKPWYGAHRDTPPDLESATALYGSLDELDERWRERVRTADLVLVGSYVPEGVAVGRWALNAAEGVTAFYDIDTPVTLEKLAAGDFEYLDPQLIPRYDLYLSFTGGPTLRRIETEYGARRARAFYCTVDPERYRPERRTLRYDLGYMGTYSDDRQPTVERLLLEPARELPKARFCVAGPQYPATLEWPENVQRIEHLPPTAHPAFYNEQRFTLNVTRRAMIASGWSPSVRLFEAAACGTPIISDAWPGLEQILEPEREIWIARTADDVLRLLRDPPVSERRAAGDRARRRVLAEHTAEKRVDQLAKLVAEAAGKRPVAAVR